MNAPSRPQVSAPGRTYSGVLCGFLLLAGASVSGVAAADAASGQVAPAVRTGAAPTEVVLEILAISDSEQIAADASGDTLIGLRDASGVLYLAEADFARLRLRLPAVAPLVVDGSRYFPPTAIRGSRVSLDEARQRAVITVPARAFLDTHLGVPARRTPAVTPAGAGGFVNYQVYGQTVQGQTNGGLSAEFGVFAGAGVLTSSALARNGTLQENVVRLDTTYTRDFPDRLETFDVGDAISDPASWGNALRFGGVRWSSDFALRPDLITSPLMTTGGTAAVPSTVDIFVNNALVGSSDVPAGPFVVDRLPTVNGTGDVSVVVQDALGHTQVLTQSFYSSVNLLTAGLSQYAIDVGDARNDYAQASDHYGALLGEASYRRGITDEVTLEAHAETMDHHPHAVGAAAAVGVGKFAILNLTVASGGDAGGSGQLYAVGLEHRGQRMSFAASSRWASDRFAEIGQALDPAQRERQRSLLQTGVDLGRAGSLSLAYVREAFRAFPAVSTVSLSESLSLGARGNLNLSITRATTGTSPGEPAAGQNSTSVYLLYVVSLGDRRSAGLSALGGSGSGAPRDELLATLTESPPVGPGSGYRLSAASSGDYDADWRQQFGAGSVEVEAVRTDGVSGQSAYATGALTWLNGSFGATRPVNGSFALVDLGGLPDIPVYVENQVVAHTDDSGRALLYDLRAYEVNHISIQPDDLPLDTSIGASSIIVVPPFRSGVVAHFAVQRVHAATFRLVTDNGLVVPVGATVTLKGEQFPVVSDGEVYVTDLDHGMAGKAEWPQGSCRFRLEPPPPGELQPDLGTIRCRRPL